MNSHLLPSAWCRWSALIGTLALLAGALPASAANLPPQLLIHNPTNELTAAEDTPILLRVVVADVETSAGDLQLTVKPVDSRLLPAGNIVVEGQGNERVIRLTPAPDASGASGVVVAVEDGSGGIAQGQAYLTWTPVDDPPVLAPIPHQITAEGAPPLWVPFSFTTPESPDSVRFTAGSSRSNLATLPTITTTGTNRWLNLRLANGFVGSSVITIYPQAKKEVAASASVSFALTVLPREFALTNAAGITGERAVVFDANRDGGLDVAVGLQTGFTVLSQNRSSLQLPIAASSLALGDADGDGDVDAYLAEAAGPGVYWQNTSPLTTLRFGQMAPFFARKESSANAAWADFDGDGDLDLVAGGGTPPVNSLALKPVLFARNDGAGSFVTLTNRLPAASDALLVADFDGDGAPDVLLGSGLGQTNQAVVWRNEGGFRFTPTSWRVPAPLLMSAGAVDFDGDGRLDLWVLHRSSANVLGSPRVLALWRQTSVGFAEVLRLPGEAVAQAGPPAWGDFDGDGWLDLVAPRLSPAVWGTSLGARVTNCFALYRNDGRGGFTAGNYLFGNGAGYSPAAGDFNRDGSLDLWVPEGQGRLMFNQLRRPNLPPEPPSGLFALAEGTNVVFTWLPARDLNQTAPLTYNLRVGTRPGSNDVVASMSLDDGTRLLLTPGNAGFALSRRLRLGPVDTDGLYWSVQAVDNSFAGGMWAPEQSIRVEGIPNESPVIRGMADVVMNEDTTAVLAVTVTDDFSSPSQVVTEVFTSNLKLFPTFKQGPARATVFSPSTNRPITLRPAENAFGEAEITMIATDGRGARSTNQVKVTVLPVNDAPFISEPQRQVVFMGQPIPPVSFTVGDVESAPDSLQVFATSLTPDLIATSRIGLSTNGARRELTATPEAGRRGLAEIELTVWDGSSENGSRRQRVFIEVRDQAFTPVAGALAEEPASTLTWGDFDGDGRPDLLTVNRDTRALRLWHNEGAGTFSVAAADLSAAGEVTLVAAGDLDGDGDLDIVTIGHDGKAAWLRNDGDRFSAHLLPAGYLGAAPAALKVADADGNGSKDVALVSTATSAVMLKVWRNLPSGFSLRASSFGSLTLTSQELSAVVFADQDADGRMDLEVAFHALATAPDTTSLRLLGTADGTFAESTRPWHRGHRELLAWDDMTGDGLGDALVVQAGRPWVTVFAGQPTPSYVPSATFELPLGNGVTGDLNGDGQTDLVSYGGAAIRPLLNSVVSGWFALPMTVGVGTLEGIPAPLADMDGDGDVDLAALVFDRNSALVAGVIRNDLLVTNQPPGPVNSASHLVNADGSVALRWQPAVDAEQTNALTYNLRMGTAPGSNDVWAAEALPDGRKLVPGPGNLGWRTSLMLKDLKPGRTYYWSVQAVDASFAGGPFSPERSFLLVGPPEFTGPTSTSLPTVAAEGDEPVRLAFTLMDPENPDVVPDVTWDSSDRHLLPDDRIRWEGTGTNRTLVLRPVAGWAGAAVVELRATSATSGNTGTHRVTLRVAPGANYSFTVRRELAVRTGSSVGLDLAFGIPADTFSNLTVTRSPSHGRLTGVPPRVNYEPEPGFVGFDRVIYAGDHVGGLGLAGEVVLVVGEPKRVNTVVKRGPGKTLEFSVNGRPHVGVRFESSLDLKFWQTVEFMSLDAAGELNFGISPEVPDGGTFYRLVEIP